MFVKYLVCFSSVAARFGNRGQCDYAAANEVLNKMAIHEKRKRDQSTIPLQVVRSIGWGPWDGGMVTPSLRKHFQNMGVSLISLTDGAKTFANLMSPTYKEVEWIVGKGERIAGQNSLPVWRIQLDAKKHNYLLDHQIRTKVVIPIAQIVLWIKHAIQTWCRDNFVHNEQILIQNLSEPRSGEIFSKPQWEPACWPCITPIPMVPQPHFPSLRRSANADRFAKCPPSVLRAAQPRTQPRMRTYAVYHPLKLRAFAKF